MEHVNHMKDKILSTLHSIVDEWELEWVEIADGGCRGAIRLMQAGRFQTLLKIEYEFQQERYRLLIYREGKHICGRCGIDYDDGAAIEQILGHFRRLIPQTNRAPSKTDRVPAAIGIPPAALTCPASHGSRFEALLLSASKSLPF